MKIGIYPPQTIHELGKRSNQEDCISPPLGQATIEDRLFVMCDGMGGHERGEVASSAICQGLTDYFHEHICAEDVLKDVQLEEALEYAYQQLDAKDNGAFRKAGTTLTMLYFHRGGCTAAHIGDSRIYHVRPSSRTILYKSRDHSLVFELYQMGEISYDEMKTHPRKNQISRAMIPGKEERQEADIVHITDIKPDDYFFICSDGVLENMDDEDIIDWLVAPDDDLKCQKLVDMTQDNDDNHSAYLVHISEVTAEEGDGELLNDEQTVRFNAINIHPPLKEKNDDDIRLIPENEASSPKHEIPIKLKQVKRKKLRSKWIFILILFLSCIIVVLGYSLLGGSSQLKNEKIQQDDSGQVETPKSVIVNSPVRPITKDEQLNARSVMPPRKKKNNDSIRPVDPKKEIIRKKSEPTDSISS